MRCISLGVLHTLHICQFLSSLGVRFALRMRFFDAETLLLGTASQRCSSGSTAAGAPHTAAGTGSATPASASCGGGAEHR